MRYHTKNKPWQRYPSCASLESLRDHILVIDKARAEEINNHYKLVAEELFREASKILVQQAATLGITLSRSGKIRTGDLEKLLGGPKTTYLSNTVDGEFEFDPELLRPEDKEYLDHVTGECSRADGLILHAKAVYDLVMAHYRNTRYVSYVFPEIPRLMALIGFSFDCEPISEVTQKKLKPRNSWVLDGHDVEIFNRLLVEINISKSQKG